MYQNNGAHLCAHKIQTNNRIRCHKGTPNGGIDVESIRNIGHDINNIKKVTLKSDEQVNHILEVLDSCVVIETTLNEVRQRRKNGIVSNQCEDESPVYFPRKKSL